MIKDESRKIRVGEVLHHLLEVVRTLTRVLAPFMPDTAIEMRNMLAISDGSLKSPWGQGFSAGHKVNPPKALFPRVIIPETGKLEFSS